MHISFIWKENILNRAIFPCLFIIRYFDFSASTGGFDLSLLHTISGTSVSNYIDFTPVSVFGGDIFKILNNIPHMLGYNYNNFNGTVIVHFYLLFY